MNPTHSEIVPMAITNEPIEETHELIRVFHQTKKTLPILRNIYLTFKNVKPVLNAIAGYELSHKRPQLSINDAESITDNLINVSTAVKNHKYIVNPTNQ